MADLIGSPAPYREVPDIGAEAPTERGGAQALERASQTEAGGLEKLGAGAMELAKPIAEAQAASDLQNQKVTLGADGKIQVLNPARSLIFGAAGDAYGQTVAAGTVAQAGGVVDKALADIHAQHLYDPEGEATAGQAFLSGLKGATGNPIVDEAIQQRAQQRLTEHNDNNVEQTARLRLTNDVDALRATKENSVERMATMASQGGVNLDSPGEVGDKLRQEWGSYSAAQDALAKAPGVKYPPELRALDDTHVKNRLTAESYMGQIDKYMSGEMPGGLPAAKAVVAQIEQMQDIDRQEKRILLQDANSRIQSNYLDYTARKQENRQANALWEEGMTKGGLSREALPLIAGAIQRTKDLGDTEEAARLQHLYDGWRAAAPVESLPPAQRNGVLYGPPVTQPAAAGEPGTGPGHWERLNDEAGSLRWVPDQTPAAAPAAPVSRANSYFIGDSVADGFRSAAGAAGDTAVGRSPAAVNEAIASINPADLKGKTVYLSTGYSNDPKADVSQIQSQIDALKQKGVEPANIRIIGVGDRADFAGLNDKLAGVAKSSGAVFTGPLDPANLRRNPNDKSDNGVHLRDWDKGLAAISGGGGAPKEPEVAPGLTAHAPTAPDGTALPPGFRWTGQKTDRGGWQVEEDKGGPPAAASASAAGGALTLDDMSNAILGHEGGTATSPQGARGPGQIMPATFAQYAKPGENIDNRTDNLAVHKRIIADYMQRWPNDPARVAVAYFSGPDNVRPTSQPGPAWIENRHDVNEDVAAYVANVTARLGKGGGGGGPVATAGAPGAKWTYTVTAADVAAHPDLASDYLRQTLAAPENRYESTKTIVDAMERQAEHGATDLPDNAMIQVKQWLNANPNDQRAPELEARYNAAVAAVYSGGAGGGGPPAAPRGPGEPLAPTPAAYDQRAGQTAAAAAAAPRAMTAAEKQGQIARAAVTAPDIFQRDAFVRWGDLEKKRDENIAKAPYDYYANPATRVLARPVTPIDPARPETLIPGIVDRYQAGQVISQKTGAPAPAIFQQPGDKSAFEAVMRGPQAGAVAIAMAQALPAPVLMRMADEPAFVGAVNSMRNSGDYSKAAAAFSVMDAMQAQNSPEFEAKFQGGLKDLAWWQGVGSSLPPDQFAKAQAERHDPGYEEKMKPFDEAATKYISQNSIDTNYVVNRMSSSWGGSAAPAPGGVPSGANAQILYDWTNAFREGVRDALDPSSAAAAADKIAAAKWQPSAANGGRLTAYPPELFTKNPDGSNAFAGAPADAADRIIDNELRTALELPSGLRRGQTNIADMFGGPEKMTGDQLDRINQFYGPRILQGDAQTKRDIASQKPPSYAIYLQDKSGRWFTPTDNNGEGMRIRFGPDELKQMEVGQARAEQAPPPPEAAFQAGP